jgi:hypothetical protein
VHPRPPTPAVTDSAWFWIGLFSLMALVGSAAISRKFDARQGQLEGRYLGREQAAMERNRRAAGLPPIDLAEAAREREGAATSRIVPLWTLMSLAATGAAVSFAMLARERRQQRTGQ